MIYRFQILSEKGLFEGWAHDSDEMKAKFQAEHPGDCYVFLYGNAPINLPFRYYKVAVERGLSKDQIAVLDAIFGDIEADIAAAHDPYQGETS